jgi:hypothetical protein
MLSAVRKLLDSEMTIAEWIGTAAMLAVPYLVVGMAWTAFMGNGMAALTEGQIVSIVASILSWPVLLLAVACPI